MNRFMFDRETHINEYCNQGKPCASFSVGVDAT